MWKESNVQLLKLTQRKSPGQGQGHPRYVGQGERLKAREVEGERQRPEEHRVHEADDAEEQGDLRETRLANQLLEQDLCLLNTILGTRNILWSIVSRCIMAFPLP